MNTGPGKQGYAAICWLQRLGYPQQAGKGLSSALLLQSTHLNLISNKMSFLKLVSYSNYIRKC
jgi:hypothetical protein